MNLILHYGSLPSHLCGIYLWQGSPGEVPFRNWECDWEIGILINVCLWNTTIKAHGLLKCPFQEHTAVSFIIPVPSEQSIQWYGHETSVAAPASSGQQKRMSRPLSSSTMGRQSEVNPNVIFRRRSSGHIGGSSVVFRKNSASYSTSRDCEPRPLYHLLHAYIITVFY